jgi:hypothetical protein
MSESGKWDVTVTEHKTNKNGSEVPYKVSIYIKKFTELIDEWTMRKLGSKSGVTPKILSTDKDKDKDKDKDIYIGENGILPIEQKPEEPQAKKIIPEPKIKKPIPPDFVISDRVREWAIKKKYNNLPEHLESFINTCLANGYKYLDWDAAFMNAVRSNWARIEPGNKKAYEL